MSNLYETLDEKGLFLYTHHNEITLRHKDGHQFLSPITLATDYTYGLSDTIFNSTLYYAYITTNSTLCLRSILENIIPYEKKKIPAFSYQNPTLIPFRGRLLIFVELIPDEPDREHELLGLLPYEDDTRFFHVSFSSPISFFFYPLKKTLFGAVFHKGGPEFYAFSPDLSYEKLVKDTSAQTDSVISELKKETEKMAKKLDDLILEKTQKDQIIQYQKNQLESAKKQYNELKDIAEKYRDELQKRSLPFTY